MTKNYRSIIFRYSWICLFLFFLYLAGFFIFPQERKSRSQVSALLNPKYLDQIDTILITKDALTLQITKTANHWQGQLDDISFFIDEKVIADFFSVFAQKRDLYIHANKFDALNHYNLTEQQACRIQIGAKTDFFSDIFFGSENYVSSKIFLRTQDTDTIFSTKNNLGQFLQLEIKFWADMKIIPDVMQVPIEHIKHYQLQFYDNGKKTISFVRGTKINPPENAFLERIFSSRGGDIFSQIILDIAQPILKLDFETQTSSNFFTIYKKKATTTDDEHYFIHTATLPYCLEISAWTYKRLFENYHI